MVSSELRGKAESRYSAEPRVRDKKICPRRELNPCPCAHRADALTTELQETGDERGGTDAFLHVMLRQYKDMRICMGRPLEQ